MDHKKPFKVLHTLPIIKGMTGIAKTMGNMFQLLQVQTEVCKQRQLTCINASHRLTGLQRGDERGLVDEHLGGRSQSFF